MKTILFLLFSTLVVIGGCQRSDRQLTVISKQKKTQNKDWIINVNYSHFSSATPAVNSSCQQLNDTIDHFIRSLQDSLKGNAAATFRQLNKIHIPRPSWQCELVVRDTVFMATTNDVSVRLTAYSFTGGAHGMTRFYAFNYDVVHQKMRPASEIVADRDSDFMNQKLIAHFKNPFDCFTTVPTIRMASAINFSPREICFTFEQYQLGPYACGWTQVIIPRQEIGRHLRIDQKL